MNDSPRAAADAPGARPWTDRDTHSSDVSLPFRETNEHQDGPAGGPSGLDLTELTSGLASGNERHFPKVGAVMRFPRR